MNLLNSNKGVDKCRGREKHEIPGKNLKDPHLY